MTPDITREALADYANEVLAGIEAERESQFGVIRGSALIAVCCAFEYLVKVTFVQQAALDPHQAARRLANSRLRLAISDVFGSSAIEQWFAFADRLFEQLSEAHPQMHGRVQRFLLDYVWMPLGELQLNRIRELLANVDATKLNEAFLTRSGLVHNGGRVGTQLARATGLPIGGTYCSRPKRPWSNA